jgi:hypothetical protein
VGDSSAANLDAMKALVLLLLLLTSWTEQGVEVTLVNPEVTRDNKYVLVHFRLRALSSVNGFSWQTFCQVVNVRGEAIPQAADCGVDTGTGNRITMGPFPLKKGEKGTLMLYYLAEPADFPVQVVVNGQTVGKPLARRR